MVKAERQDNGIAKLFCTIPTEDYRSQFEQKLKEQAENADIKGFRKGKVPMRMIKKQFGQGILIELITDELNEELNAYLKANSRDYIGQPLPAQEQEPHNWDVEDLSDFHFTFDIGIRPKISLDELMEDNALNLEQFKIEVSEETIDEELELARKRHGDTIHPEGDIREDDILVIRAHELEGDEPREDGWETEFTIMVDRIADDELRETIEGNDQGFTFRFNIYELEKESTEEYVDKYFLQREEGEEDIEVNAEFEGTIHQINRTEPAELDEEFFDEYLEGESVSNEEEARESIREEIEQFYEMQSQNLLQQHLYRALMENADIDLPDQFLQRWLKTQKEEESEEDEEVDLTEQDYRQFQEEMKWYLIQSGLEERYDFEIEGPELQEFIKRKVDEQMGQMYGQAGGAQFQEMILQQIMQDEEQVRKYYNQLLTKRCLEEAADEVHATEQDVGIDEFKEKAEAFNKEMEADRPLGGDADEEE